LIGVAFVNAGRIVAPFGGMERMLGTNPISFAAPAGKEKPFLIDIATSIVAEGKVWVRLHSKQSLPQGWILDKEGMPSANPADLYAGGVLLPFGGYAGHKGYGLSLVVEILCGLLNGAGCSYSEEFKGGNGVFLEAINIQNFTPVEEFRHRMDRLASAMRNSKRAPGSSEILFPGDPEAKMEQKRLKEGIPVPDVTWQELATMAKKLGLNMEKVVGNPYNDSDG
jgi:uncharacterized oxidoreductase